MTGRWWPAARPCRWRRKRISPDGHHVFLANKFPLVDARGRFDGVGAIAHDITARKHTEEALRKTAALLASAERIANVGSWEWDVPSGRLTWSDQMYRIFDVEPATFAPTFEQFLDRIVPEDRPRVTDVVRTRIAAGQPFDVEYAIRTSDAAPRLVHARGVTVCDGTGQPQRVIGTALDITERTQKEEELRRLNRTLRALSNSDQARMGPRTRRSTCGRSARSLSRTAGIAWRGWAMRCRMKGGRWRPSRMPGPSKDTCKRRR